MCELLALSANTPTDMTFSFRGLARRGGATGEHGDGWGLASFDPSGQGVKIYREDTPAAFSKVAAEVADLALKAHCSIAHIRKATQGVIAIENCHPFHRQWHGQEWVFAHNGDIKGELDLSGPFRPFGSTDSEAAFCWILNGLAQEAVDPHNPIELFQALLGRANQLAAMGIFNCLISNGAWLFAYATTKLHRLTRRAPFTTATLADEDLTVDFAQVTTHQDVVTIVSTAPLTTNELWLPLQSGEALLLRSGELVAHYSP
ncbi:MAG: class II glutamine amidotransferase [Cyanobacteria bacterium]|nr:class II glutamine amidotransferase [Cyanobacteriota bacterium]